MAMKEKRDHTSLMEVHLCLLANPRAQRGPARRSSSEPQPSSMGGIALAPTEIS